MPFGISSAGEIWQKAMIEEFGDIAEIIVDDMLITGTDQASHDLKLEKLLSRVAQSGLKLNGKKCEISRSQVEFAGHLLTESGLRPSPERIRALKEMPEPKS